MTVPFPPPTLVVFDMDGTLTDTTGTIVSAWREALRIVRLPVPTDALIRQQVGRTIAASLPTLVPGVDEPTVRRFHDVYGDLYRQRVAAEEPPLFAGVRETLERLRAGGIALGIATSKSRRGLDRVMEAHGLAEWVGHDHRASGDDGPSKPHPQMLLDLLARTRHEPARCVMVGDTTFDLDMAHAAGCRAVGVLTGAHDRAVLKESAPVAILDSVKDLIPLLRSMGAITDRG